MCHGQPGSRVLLDEKNRPPILRQGGDGSEDRLARLLVEPDRRLVEQDQGRIEHQRSVRARPASARRPRAIPPLHGDAGRRWGRRSAIRSIRLRISPWSERMKAPISTFSQTDMPGKRLRSCGTWTTPRMSRSFDDRRLMSSPRSITWPALGRRSPLIVLRTVDFPAPLGPIKHTILPASTVRSTPLRINPAPYPAVTPESVRMIESPRPCASTPFWSRRASWRAFHRPQSPR